MDNAQLKDRNTPQEASVDGGAPSGVSIENLSLSFGDTRVLKSINLEIEPGEFFAFLGPSGSGKSTLLRAIAGFGPKPDGRILVGGQDVASLPPWRRDVGMVFQSYALWPHMTVAQNVAFGLEERRVGRAEIRERVGQALELVGLQDFASRRPSQLSGGQQQRVALARTIIVRPRVLLLDEPLSNLDANLRIQMRQEILALQRRLKLTTIFVTHDQEEANTTSDRMAVLDDGVIQQVGTPMDLYDNPANSFVANFLGTANILSGKITTEASGTVFVADGGLQIPLGGGQEGRASIVMRPQAFEIQTVDSDSAGALQGTVSAREFLGSTIRYVVDAANEKLIIDQAHLQGEQPFNIGATISFVVTQDHIRVLPD